MPQRHLYKIRRVYGTELYAAMSAADALWWFNEHHCPRQNYNVTASSFTKIPDEKALTLDVEYEFDEGCQRSFPCTSKTKTALEWARDSGRSSFLCAIPEKGKRK